VFSSSSGGYQFVKHRILYLHILVHIFRHSQYSVFTVENYFLYILLCLFYLALGSTYGSKQLIDMTL